MKSNVIQFPVKNKIKEQIEAWACSCGCLEFYILRGFIVVCSECGVEFTEKDLGV